MSLYIFGKLVPKPLFDSTAFFRNHPGLHLDGIDPEDVHVLDEQECLSEAGIYFAIYSSSDSLDAIRLWNEAARAATKGEAIEETDLGREVHQLFGDSQLKAGGIAVVDGGVETVLQGSPEQCWEWFKSRIPKPWDTLDNPLLIWTANETSVDSADE